MINLEKSRLFEKHFDPSTGVISYHLVKKPAPITQSFYFVNDALSPDGRYLWFYCAFPPSGSAKNGRFLGRIDFKLDDMRWFPETAFLDASPVIHPKTGEAYWTTDEGIFCRGPKPEDQVRTVCLLPSEFLCKRTPRRIATHLTFSADLKSVNIDAQIGRQWYIGEIELESGKLIIWKEMDKCYNHAQFSPVDPELQLIAQDWWIDCVTGEFTFFKNRVWLIRKNEEAKPMFEGIHDHWSHEWWAADGKGIWYVDFQQGTCRYDLQNKDTECVWQQKNGDGIVHAQSSTDEKWLVGDLNTYGRYKNPQKVVFFNVATQKETAIVSNMKKLGAVAGRYHIHPHPRFINKNQLIMYTANEKNGCTLALTPVNQLI